MSDPHTPDEYYDKGEAKNWEPLNDNDILEVALTAIDEHMRYMHTIAEALKHISISQHQTQEYLKILTSKTGWIVEKE